MFVQLDCSRCFAFSFPYNVCSLYFQGPAHYLTKDKAKSKDDPPSSTFVSSTGRLHTPPGVVLVSVSDPFNLLCIFVDRI